MMLKVDLYDDWVEWNFTIMAHGLPNDQYVLDEK